MLFQTNVGHAGEFMQEILDVRNTTRGPPMLMSDALSANHVKGHEFDKCLCNARQYFIRYFDGLSTFCTLPGAPVDNNEIERLIKLIVRARKNSLFFKTADGTDISDIITSMLAICHENEVNAFHYLNAVQRNQAAIKVAPEKWLSWKLSD